MPKNPENKLPLTDRHLALKRLKESRNAEFSIELYLDGKLNFDDLTDDEQLIYERVVWLTSRIKQNGKARFDRDPVIEDHCRRWEISEATANRDLKIVNIQRRKLTEAELELHKWYLYQKACDAIEKAEKDDMHGQGARGMASGIKEALRALGIDGRGKEGTVDYSKIEQHINILIADEMTQKIFIELIKNKVSVLKHNTTLDEILALEEAAKAKVSKITPIEYETLGSESTAGGD
jgi:hypothetical protein